MIEKVRSKAVLVSLTISVWTNQVVSVKENDEIKVKRLIDRNEFHKIVKIENKMRTYHYKHTLTFFGRERRLLPVCMYEDYVSFMRECEKEFNEEVERFVDNFPLFVAKAAKKKIDLERIPSDDELRKKFGVRLLVEPISSLTDFDGLELSNEVREKLIKEYFTVLSDAIERAGKECYDRAWKVVSHLVERLESGRIFRNSLIENVKETTELLSGFNSVFESSYLEELIKGLRKLIVDADELRKNDNLKCEILAKAKRILEKIQ